MELKHGLAAAFGSIWMMEDRARMRMQVLLNSMSSIKIESTSPERGLLWMAGGRVKQAQKSVAVMGLYGMIDKRHSWVMDFMGGTSTDMFGAVFDQLAEDPMCKGIVLDVDSPGGSSTGCFELCDKIYAARGTKPIVAVCNSQMCSAAYLIASSAPLIVSTPTGDSGSIGVWSAAAEITEQLKQDGVSMHVWRAEGSPNKAALLPYEKFSEDAIKDEQKEVDRIYDDFLASVARNRGVTTAQAQKSFGKGSVMGSKAALSAGLIDRISTDALKDVVMRMDAGKITLGSLGQREALEAAFTEPIAPDESWRDENATARLRSKLVLAGKLRRTAEPDDALFVYGTFKREGVLAGVIGREPTYSAASLSGFDRVCGDLKGRDEDGPFCDMLPDDKGKVNGKLVMLSDSELKLTDEWETRYERRDVTLDDGTKAQAYFLKPESKDDLEVD